MSDDSGSEVFFSRKAIQGVPWLVVSKFILFFIYFGISVVVVRALGKEKYGLLALCRNLCDYLCVFCGLGMTAALSRFIPELVVHKNRKGLFRLLWKTAALQVLAVAAIGTAVIFAKPFLDHLFGTDFKGYLWLSVVLMAVSLLKNYVATAFTSLFEVTAASVLSIIQGILWLGSAVVVLHFVPEIGAVFGVEIGTYGAVYIVGLLMLFRTLRKLDLPRNTWGIGKRRVIKFSGANLANSMARMLMYKYTEVFFLGAVAGAGVVGIYDLGYTLAGMVIPFIPHAVQPLFTSGFSEAYTRDPRCLGRLISSFYKMLALMSLPLAMFGMFFAPKAITLIYGSEMAGAGPLAAIFCLLHVLPLVSIPLSMALQAKEKVLNMLPMLLLQITVNLVLDYALIVWLKLGVYGGALAVFGTFVLTIPVRLWWCARLIGSISFPGKFVLRVALTFAAVAAVLSPLSGRVNLALLFVLGAVYMVLGFGALRLLRFIREEDVADFRMLDVKPLNKFLDLIAG